MTAEKKAQQDPNVARILEKIATAKSVLVALSNNPSMDEMAAALGLTMMLDRIGKHATAIYSGATPNALEFLRPEETFEKNTHSLQEFIIALDKEKADHLRYKVDGNYVKIYITPYKTNITKEDLEFARGDYNVDLVIAMNVLAPKDLDGALAEHGRILHNASTINISTGEAGRFAEIEWIVPKASSVSEMIFTLVNGLKEEDGVPAEVATALLTGIVAATNRFSNEKTRPTTMTVAARLMAAGADQQLVSANIPVAVATMEERRVGGANLDEELGESTEEGVSQNVNENLQQNMGASESQVAEGQALEPQAITVNMEAAPEMVNAETASEAENLEIINNGEVELSEDGLPIERNENAKQFDKMMEAELTEANEAEQAEAKMNAEAEAEKQKAEQAAKLAAKQAEEADYELEEIDELEAELAEGGNVSEAEEVPGVEMGATQMAAQPMSAGDQVEQGMVEPMMPVMANSPVQEPYAGLMDVPQRMAANPDGNSPAGVNLPDQNLNQGVEERGRLIGTEGIRLEPIGKGVPESQMMPNVGSIKNNNMMTSGANNGGPAAMNAPKMMNTPMMANVPMMPMQGGYEDGNYQNASMQGMMNPAAMNAAGNMAGMTPVLPMPGVELPPPLPPIDFNNGPMMPPVMPGMGAGMQGMNPGIQQGMTGGQGMMPTSEYMTMPAAPMMETVQPIQPAEPDVQPQNFQSAGTSLAMNDQVYPPDPSAFRIPGM